MLASAATRPPASLDELLPPTLAARLERLDIHSRKVFSGKLQGERHSKRRGQSVEFDDYRTYVPGDDLRHIDWNVFARLDRYFIKLFLEEEDLALHLLIDASASMDAGSPNKLIFAQRLAMAIGYIGLVRNNRVRATVFGGRHLHRLGSLRGKQNTRKLGAFLLNAPFAGNANAINTQTTGNDPDSDTAAAAAAHNSAARPPGGGAGFTDALRAVSSERSGSGVVLLLSDMLIPEGYDAGLKYLAGNAKSWDVCCVQILSPGELDPASEPTITGANPDDSDDTDDKNNNPKQSRSRRHRRQQGIMGDLRLVDAESGAEAEITITPTVLDQYREAVRTYCDDLKHYCRRRNMGYVLAPSTTPVEPLVVDRMRRLGFVR